MHQIFHDQSEQLITSNSRNKLSNKHKLTPSQTMSDIMVCPPLLAGHLESLALSTIVMTMTKKY